MGPVSASIEIDVPRARIFADLVDLSRRPSFTDHFVEGFRLTRIESRGVGAGARFRYRIRPGRQWFDTTIVEATDPSLIVERGRGGRINKTAASIVWELAEGPGSLTTVTVTSWSEPGPLGRIADALGGASIRHGRAWKQALRRLRDQLEEGAADAETVSVAGGNPHATGIP